MPQNELPAVAVLQQVKTAFMFVWLSILIWAKTKPVKQSKKSFKSNLSQTFVGKKSINHQ